MKKGVLKDADKYAKAHKRRSRWYKLVVFLAAAVVFCTTYALILPAITLEREKSGYVFPENEWFFPFDSSYEIESETSDISSNTSDEADSDPPSDVTSDDQNEETLDVAIKDVDTSDEITSAESTDDTAFEETTESKDESDASYETTGSDEITTDEVVSDTEVPETTFDESTAESDETTVETDISSDTSFDMSIDTSVESSGGVDSVIEETTAETSSTETSFGHSWSFGNFDDLWSSFGKHDWNDSTVEDPKDTTKDDVEHIHSEKCYKDGELICGLEEKKDVQDLPKEAKKLLEILPSDKEITENIEGYYADGDNEGLEAYIAELRDMIDYVRGECEKLNAEREEPISIENELAEIEKLISDLTDGRIPLLKDDSAYVSGLTFGDTYVEGREDDTEYLVASGGTIVFNFELSADSYTGDIFEHGRIKYEFVLPFNSEKVEFADISWFDEADIIEDEGSQVLVGYKDMKIPESAEGSISLKVNNAEVGDNISLTLGAASVYGAWDDICAEHEVTEKLTAVSAEYTVIALYTPEQQQKFYELFESRIDEIKEPEIEAVELEDEIELAYHEGKLTKAQYNELLKLLDVKSCDPNRIAEPSHGDNWKALVESGWFEEYSDYAYYTEEDYDFAYFVDDEGSEESDDKPVSPSDVQIEDHGGSNENPDDGVSVSKTIEGTDLENVFDITLKVSTTSKIEEVVKEPDMAVVIVMDISNTMTDDFGGITRYQAAMDAAEDFLDKFAESNILGVSKIGYVAFNTDAHEIFGLESCTSYAEANALKNTMRTATGKIINAGGYGESHSRFTNIEAGLKMASDMLDGVSNKNKFIIFLSDGFPTTYIESGYNGYDPYDSTGRFYDYNIGAPCLYGTSYSDEAAIRARKMATSIKNSGTTIFSIGVDVGGQTIAGYDTHTAKDGFSVIDRTGTTYEIGGAADESAYKNWLGNSIGSGYYYDSTNTAGLIGAYNQIFETIKQEVTNASEADWVAEDPMPPIANLIKDIEFIGFYDKSPKLIEGDLYGEHSYGAENTASFAGEKITWDLKRSGYVESKNGDKTIYTYQLVYRVRLKNENDGFVERDIYDTNGETTLQYKVIKEINGTSEVSESKEIDFPIPSVFGYIGELEFDKVDTRGSPLQGAEFTLSHDTAACSGCHGDGGCVELLDMVAVSGADGSVYFDGIPSGHIYKLTETKIPDGYVSNGKEYTVIIAYDEITVLVNGDEAAWNGSIENRVYYELPQTGGSGSEVYVISGAVLICSSVLLIAYTNSKRRKNDD